MQKMRELARAVAAKMKRKVWWAEVEDLEQEAFLAMHRALPRFDERVGVPLERYLARVARLELGGYLWRQSAPVSANSHERKELAGLQRAELSKRMLDPTATVQERLEHAQFRAAVRQRLLRVLRGHELARPVLYWGRQPEDVAVANRVAVDEVYRARNRAWRALQNDPELWRLWKESA